MYRFGCSAKLASMLAAHCVVSQLLTIYSTFYLPVLQKSASILDGRDYGSNEHSHSGKLHKRQQKCNLYSLASNKCHRQGPLCNGPILFATWLGAQGRVRCDKSPFRSCGIHGHETNRYSVEWDLTLSGIDSTWSQRHVKRHTIWYYVCVYVYIYIYIHIIHCHKIY